MGRIKVGDVVIVNNPDRQRHDEAGIVEHIGHPLMGDRWNVKVRFVNEIGGFTFAFFNEKELQVVDNYKWMPSSVFHLIMNRFYPEIETTFKESAVECLRLLDEAIVGLQTIGAIKPQHHD